MRLLKSRRLALFGALVLLTALLGIGWLLLTSDLEDGSREPIVDAPDTSEGIEDRDTTAPALEETGSRNLVEDAPLFTPERVILNVGCRMRMGEGAAKEVAVLTFLDENGTEFAVLGDTGALARGRIDFRANHARIGLRADGSIVYGFGDLRLNSKVFREESTDEPVRIFHNDHVVYETNKAWDFGVADDGTSFFVHEPAPGGASRLVVRDLDRNTQVEYDLDTRLTPVSDYSVGHTLGYSNDGSEVVFMSAQEDSSGMGVYYFYPVEDTAKPRRITVEAGWAALLTSSENGYFVDSPDDLEPHEFGDVWQVTRRRIDVSNGETEDLWSRRLRIP